MFLGGRISLRVYWSRYPVVLPALVAPVLLFFLRAEYKPDLEAEARSFNVVRAAVTVLSGFFFLAVGFRAAGSVARERQQRTLDHLLCLPLDRTAILAAKWWGCLLRPSWASYTFAAVLFLGFTVWALYPKAAPFLVLMLLAHVAFAASLGLYISVIAPNRTWANFVFALILFLISVPALFMHFFLPPSPPDLLTNVIKVGLNPVATWWFWTNDWLTAQPLLGIQIAGSLVGTAIFAAAAYLLWLGARGRFGRAE
jgi:ABC-type Na+ efflux pump permease subunit